MCLFNCYTNQVRKALCSVIALEAPRTAIPVPDHCESVPSSTPWREQFDVEFVRLITFVCFFSCVDFSV